MKNTKYIIVFAALILGFISANAQDERKFIRSGNSQFADSAFLESEIEYRKALDKTGDSFEAQFNLGDALFKQEKFNDALDQFQILAGTEKAPERLAQVHHNIGNSYFAMQKFEESIEAYKNALRNNHEDHDSRYNLIAAQKMLQQQQDQEQQNQDQENKDQQQDQQQENKEQEQQKDQQQDQQQNQDQQEQQKNQQQQQPEEQMSKEDAQRLLNAIQQDENELQKKLRKAKASQKTKTEKNW
ncbi:tetratricopeptide repeat protein [Carboxylicivirga sp. M1479]|uniref:tetratricopeptide repeat protein n=1 Tax=Carboxylicivirga sp. M1479 TaxID=2594476 RepID=UPI0011787D16|nr:tetratricopeptide repeat protein [Carboxylicivirga sp. M1479]TRX70320.1 tetratricopeptide repeat protein [Carboxylicivirga sp. M1479]